MCEDIKYLHNSQRSGKTIQVWKCSGLGGRCKGLVKTNGGVSEHNKGVMTDWDPCSIPKEAHALWSSHPHRF